MNLTTARPQAIDYKLLCTSLPDLYVILSPELIILEASDAYLQATLSGREAIIGKHLFDVFPESPETRSEHGAKNLKQSLQHVITFGTPHNMPIQRYDIPRPKNLGGSYEERYWLASNYPVHNQAGELTFILSKIIDVTAQQLAQHEIKMHRERFDLLAQATTDVIWDWDLLNNHIWWNEGFQRTFGFEEHSAAYDFDFWKEHLHPEDLDRVVNSLHALIEHGNGLWSESYRFRRQDDTYATVVDRGYTLRDEKGIAYRMVGTIVDISEQLEAEHKVKEGYLRFRNLLDAMPNLAWTSEPGSAPGTRVTYLNKAWYTYTGLPENLLGGGEQVIHPDDLSQVTDHWIQSQADNQCYEQEIRLKNLQNGRYRWFLTRAIPVYNENGTVTTWLGTCTDIDDQKKITQQLEAKDKYWERVLNEMHLHFAVFKGPMHVCEFITPKLKCLLGNREAEGQALAQVWPEAAGQGFIQVLDTVYKTGKPFFGHKTAIPEAGSGDQTKPKPMLRFNCQPLHTDSGAIEGVVAFASEVNGLIGE